MENKQNWSNSISNIRALAIIVVVFGHSIILYSSNWNIYTTKYTVPALDLLKRILDMFQMPLFFSISGYLFYFTYAKRRGILYLINSKIKRLIVPYILVSLLYVIPLRIIIHYPGYEHQTLIKLLTNILMATDIGHLWFLPALFLIFGIAWVGLWIIEKILGKNNIVNTVILFGGSLVLYFVGYKIGFGYGPLLSAYNYFIWFFVGYILCEHQQIIASIRKNQKISYVLGIIASSLIVINTIYPMSVILTIVIKIIFIFSIYVWIPSNKNKIINIISENSFGIYLFHSPLTYIIYTLDVNANPVVVVGINFIVCGIIASILTILLRKIKLGFMIGEV